MRSTCLAIVLIRRLISAFDWYQIGDLENDLERRNGSPYFALPNLIMAIILHYFTNSCTMSS